MRPPKQANLKCLGDIWSPLGFRSCFSLVLFLVDLLILLFGDYLGYINEDPLRFYSLPFFALYVQNGGLVGSSETLLLLFAPLGALDFYVAGPGLVSKCLANGELQGIDIKRWLPPEIQLGRSIPLPAPFSHLRYDLFFFSLRLAWDT